MTFSAFVSSLSEGAIEASSTCVGSLVVEGSVTKLFEMDPRAALGSAVDLTEVPLVALTVAMGSAVVPRAALVSAVALLWLLGEEERVLSLIPLA